MAKVFLSIGSNIGDRGKHLQNALVSFEQWGIKVIRSSSIYETEPVGNKNQPMFLNMVVQVETDKSAGDLLTVLMSIERSEGRERRERLGPRTLDLDILFYDDQVMDVTGLVIPHPRIAERLFVLVPLAEIAPDLLHPVLKKPVKELLKECLDKSIVTLLR